eukprot:scaffold6546_cov18-Tisochrysis_lutea.AAC.1
MPASRLNFFIDCWPYVSLLGASIGHEFASTCCAASEKSLDAVLKPETMKSDSRLHMPLSSALFLYP